MNGKVMVIGEALVDVVHRATEAADETPGGSPANVAISVARSGHHPVLLTQLADDARGLVGAGARQELRQLAAIHVEKLLSFGAHAAAITVSRPGADPPVLADLLTQNEVFGAESSND